ncbi:MAG: hypothetical protein F7C32_02700 [Desulfurococcales archaeon]|nr:hypothetical protein [Desulfurococcales archaeon]
MIEPDDIDILVSKENVRKLNTLIQQEKDIDMIEPARKQRGSTIRGLYGRVSLDEIIVDVMAYV